MQTSSERPDCLDLRRSLSWMWRNPFLADLLVEIKESLPNSDAEPHYGLCAEQRTRNDKPRTRPDLPRPCPRHITLTCHALVLVQHSPVLQTLIELQHGLQGPHQTYNPCLAKAAVTRPSALDPGDPALSLPTNKGSSSCTQSPASRIPSAGAAQSHAPILPCIVLHVGVGQLHAAELMLEAMYDEDCLLRVTAMWEGLLQERQGPGSRGFPDRAESLQERTHTRMNRSTSPTTYLPSWRGATGHDRLQRGFPLVPAVSAWSIPSTPGDQPLTSSGNGAAAGPSSPRAPQDSRDEDAGNQQQLGSDLDPESGSLQLLMDVIRLSDQYQADAVLKAAADMVMSLRPLWSWSDVLHILELPLDALTINASLAPLLFATREVMWDTFQDLECVCGDEDKMSQWMQLPFWGVEWIVNIPGLQVRSENTVFVALTQWVECGAGRRASPQQLAMLAKMLQFRHLSLPFFMTIVRTRPWFRRALTASGEDSAMEELVASYLLHSSGHAEASLHFMPWQKRLSNLGRFRWLSLRASPPGGAVLIVDISMTALEQALDDRREPKIAGGTSRLSTARDSPAPFQRSSSVPSAIGVSAVDFSDDDQEGSQHNLQDSRPSEGTRGGRYKSTHGGLHYRCNASGHILQDLPQLLVSKQVYCSGYFWVLEILLARDYDEDCLVVCLYAKSPAVPWMTACAGRLYSAVAQNGVALVTAHMQMQVYDHTLEEWDSLTRTPLPIRTGFGESGTVRFTEYYPIWRLSALNKILTPSAWQRAAYAPDNKLNLRVELVSVK